MRHLLWTGNLLALATPAAAQDCISAAANTAEQQDSTFGPRQIIVMGQREPMVSVGETSVGLT